MYEGLIMKMSLMEVAFLLCFILYTLSYILYVCINVDKLTENDLSLEVGESTFLWRVLCILQLLVVVM